EAETRSEIKNVAVDSVVQQSLTTEIETKDIIDLSKYDLSIITNPSDPSPRKMTFSDSKGNTSTMELRGGDSLSFTRNDNITETSEKIKQDSELIEKITKSENSEVYIDKKTKEKEVQQKPLPFWYLAGIFVLIFLATKIWKKIKI